MQCVSITLIFSPMKQQPLVDQGILIIQTSRSHSDTRHSIGVLWTSDRLDAETSTLQHTAPTGLGNRNSNKRAAADRRLRPRDRWDRQYTNRQVSDKNMRITSFGCAAPILAFLYKCVTVGKRQALHNLPAVIVVPPTIQ
jgi:hypothetical protein